MERFYGPEDHTEVDIARVGEPNVAVQLLHSRRNVTSETSVRGDPLPDAAFKKMTGGDRIAMKVLYQDAFSGHFHGTAMVISNVFPHTNDRGRRFGAGGCASGGPTPSPRETVFRSLRSEYGPKSGPESWPGF